MKKATTKPERDHSLTVTFRYQEDHYFGPKSREVAKRWDGRKIRIGQAQRTFPGCRWFGYGDDCRSPFVWPILEPDLLKEINENAGICIHMMEEAD